MAKIKALAPDKVMFWLCDCGHSNFAPAMQTPGNTIVCAKCEKELRWSELREEQKK